jgi:hypothetical protein
LRCTELSPNGADYTSEGREPWSGMHIVAGVGPDSSMHIVAGVGPDSSIHIVARAGPDSSSRPSSPQISSSGLRSASRVSAWLELSPKGAVYTSEGREPWSGMHIVAGVGHLFAHSPGN